MGWVTIPELLGSVVGVYSHRGYEIDLHSGDCRQRPELLSVIHDHANQRCSRQRWDRAGKGAVGIYGEGACKACGRVDDHAIAHFNFVDGHVSISLQGNGSVGGRCAGRETKGIAREYGSEACVSVGPDGSATIAACGLNRSGLERSGGKRAEYDDNPRDQKNYSQSCEIRHSDGHFLSPVLIWARRLKLTGDWISECGISVG